MNAHDDLTAEEWAEAHDNVAYAAARLRNASWYCDCCNEMRPLLGGGESNTNGLIEWRCMDCFRAYMREQIDSGTYEPDDDWTDEDAAEEE